MALYIATNELVIALELVELFLTTIITRFRTPKGIVSNRGSLFTSAFWLEIYYYAKMKRRLSTAFYP